MAAAEPAPVGGWRDAMPAVHAAIDRLHAEGLIRLSWKGQALASRAGPYRIGRAERQPLPVESTATDGEPA